MKLFTKISSRSIILKLDTPGNEIYIMMCFPVLITYFFRFKSLKPSIICLYRNDHIV